MRRAVTAAHGPRRATDYKLSLFQCCPLDVLLKEVNLLLS